MASISHRRTETVMGPSIWPAVVAIIALTATVLSYIDIPTSSQRQQKLAGHKKLEIGPIAQHSTAHVACIPEVSAPVSNVPPEFYERAKIGHIETAQTSDLAIEKAVHLGASEITVNVTAKVTVVRFRIGGAMKVVDRFPAGDGRRMAFSIMSQAGMYQGNTQVAQNGQMNVTVDGQKIDIRVVSAPGNNVIIMQLGTAIRGEVEPVAGLLSRSSTKTLLRTELSRRRRMPSA